MIAAKAKINTQSTHVKYSIKLYLFSFLCTAIKSLIAPIVAIGIEMVAHNRNAAMCDHSDIGVSKNIIISFGTPGRT